MMMCAQSLLRIRRLPRASSSVGFLLLAFAHGLAHATPSGSPVAVESEGVVEIQTEDYERYSVLRHFLHAARGRVELKSSGKPLNLAAGARVRVRGTQSGDLLYLSNDPGSVTAAGTVASSSPVLVGTLGEQRVGVILVNFDDDTSQPMTRLAADNLVFGEVGNFYWENSFGQTWLTGNTSGWYTIPVSKTVCDTNRIATEANAAATAAGVNLSQYTRLVYFFPNNACGWAGAGSTGNNPTRVFINGPRAYTVIAHEMGHAFGLLHAQGLDCDTGSLGDTCTIRSYGDPADVMGSGKGHFSAYHKERLGWIGDGLANGMETILSSGSYRITPYAASSNGVKGLRIPKGVDPVTGRQTWYYVEHRKAIGFDALINETQASNLIDTLIVHTGDPDDLGSVVLLDMTPNSDATSPSYDFRDGALALGQTYADSTSGVTIALTSRDPSGAMVTVTIGGGAPACVRSQPSVALVGPAQTIAPGTTVTYSITVTNEDGVGCGASDFAISRTVPIGWGAVLGSGTLNLVPGYSASTSLLVTSSTSATDGSYGITATALNNSATVYNTTTSAIVQIGSSSTGGTKGGTKGGTSGKRR